MASRGKPEAVRKAKHSLPKLRTVWHPWIIFGLALLAYANTAICDLVSDDVVAIRGNPLVAQFDVRRIFSTSIWYPNPKLSDLYRPLTVLSYALNYAAGGFDPLGYHLVNIVLHALNSLLVFLLLKRLLEYHYALAAALIFALHPLHTEAVAWVTGRAELLACFFMLLAWLASLPGESGEPGWRRAVISSLFFLLALLSKESALVLIPVIWCFRLVASQRERGSTSRFAAGWRDLFRARDVGFLAAAAAMLAMRRVMLGQIGPKTADTVPFVENPLVFAQPWNRLLTSIKLLVLYLWKMIWPARLSADYSYNQIPAFYAADFWFWVALVLMGLCFLLFLRSGFSSWISGGLMATLAAFTMTSNILFPTGTMFAERLAYFPLLGFSVALAAVLYHPRVAEILPAAGTTVLYAVLALFFVRTVLRNPDWASSRTLYLSMPRTSPQSAKAHALAGVEESDRNPASARAHFQEALRIYPKYEQARLGLAQADINMKNYSAAEKTLRDVLKQNPSSIEALQALVFSYRAAGKYLQALEVSDQILARQKDNGFVLAQRAMALEGLKRNSEAIEAYQSAIASGADSTEVRNRLGTLYLQAGQVQPALKEFLAAAQLEPADPLTYFNLASAYHQLGDRAQEKQAYVNFLQYWKGDPKISATIRARLNALQ
jgi:Tfp pilus assembly protein PilF